MPDQHRARKTERTEAIMPENTQQDQTVETPGMRAIFWIWMAIVVGGLAVMIAIPLGGN
jgi:hypothetical protein